MTDRTRRERVRSGLSYLGYAPLREDTWVSPRPSSEVGGLLEVERVHVRHFSADHHGDDSSLTAATWDIDGLGDAYSRWLKDAAVLVSRLDEVPTDEQAFVTRSRLVHEWRKFLFRDPGLPSELLPSPWAGDEAAAYFDAQANRLLPAAGRFVDCCLQTN